jgi:hypothetical protein
MTVADRICLAIAGGSAVLLAGALVLGTAIQDRAPQRPPCMAGSITTLTTDCRVIGALR